MKYVKWVLDLEKSTTNSVILEERKGDELRVKVGRRALGVEERTIEERKAMQSLDNVTV